MDETVVNAKFMIIGDENFDPDIATNTLKINPTKVGRKGELIRGGRLKRKESFWEISTDYKKSYDINDQLDQILNIIIPVKEELMSIISSNNLYAKIEFVINIENNEKPAMHLQKNVIDFASEIGAEIDFDLYIYS